MPLNARQIEAAIADMSVAAIRSWLKSRELPHSANTRDQILQRLVKLLREGELSEAEFLVGICSIEEASAKRISLYSLEREAEEALRDMEAFARRLRRNGITLSTEAKVAPRLPPEPTLVYVVHSPTSIRAKWAETQVRVEVDLVRQRFLRTKTTKIVVLVADIGSSGVQLRFDKPERDHSHRDAEGQADDSLYFAFYYNKACEIFGTSLTPIDLRNALRSLVETEPRVVRVESGDFRTASNSRVRFSAKSDVRDDGDWKAMHDEGGDLWAYDGEFVHWLPEASSGKLTREVFTAIDARTGKLRVEADCHEGELEYAISQIRYHQSAAP
jgi:hypothetical protein